MNKTKFPILQMTLACTISLALVSFTQLPAQPDQPSSNSPDSTRMRFVQPTLAKEPDNRGAPDDREGAGTRGDCPFVNLPPLTGLVPVMQRTLANNPERTLAPLPEKFVLGLTVAEYPTFWSYVPYSPEDIHSVKFVLLDEKNNSLTKEPILITLDRTPGVVSFRLTATEKPLEIGKY